MAEMFEQSGMNGDISNWNVENVQYMNAMFDRSSFSGDLSQWKVRSRFQPKLSLEIHSFLNLTHIVASTTTDVIVAGHVLYVSRKRSLQFRSEQF
jgi:surface protein